MLFNVDIDISVHLLQINSAYCVVLHAFLSSADLFSKSTFLKHSSRTTIRVSSSLDQDWAQHLGGPNLGQNCLNRLSADDTSRIRVVKFISNVLMTFGVD